MAAETETPPGPLLLADWCAMRAALQEQLEARPLTPEGVAALVVLAHRRPLSAAALAEAMGISKAKMTRLVRHLSQLDLVAERIGMRDRRQSFFRVAPRGENVLFELGLVLGREELEAWAAGLVALHHACRAAKAVGHRQLSEHQCALLMTCAASAAADTTPAAEAQADALAATADAAPNPAATPATDGVALTMADVVAQLVVGQSTVSMAVRVLRRDGLLETRIAPSDRRRETVELTSRGRVVASEALKAWNQSTTISV